MFGFKINVESSIERAGGEGTEEAAGAQAHGSTTTSPVSVTSPEQLGLSPFPLRSAPSTSASAAGKLHEHAQAGPSATKPPGDASAHLPELATTLKPDDLASMRKKSNDVYADGDGHAYVAIKDKVYGVWQTGLDPRVAYVLDPNTHKPTNIVLERGDGDAWQVRQSQRLPGGGPVLSHLRDPTEAENRTLANEVFDEVKRAYRAGFKSANKLYARGDKEQTSLRRAFDAYRAIKILDDQHLYNIKKEIVIPPTAKLSIPAANCGELSKLVAKLVTERGGYAEVWKFGKVDHAFAVVGRPPGATTTSFSDWKDAWIVDAWANIACPAPQYIGKFVEKMKKWERSGKIIHSDTPWPLNRAWIEAAIDGEKKRVEAPSMLDRTRKINPWGTYPSDGGAIG
jgi:hypothetical protein